MWHGICILSKKIGKNLHISKLICTFAAAKHCKRHSFYYQIITKTFVLVRMKKILFLMLAVMPTLVMAQRKVAVYVTAPEGFEADVREILGGEIATAINQNRDFQASDRTVEFARELDTNTDNQIISAVGQRFGVDLVCVANVTSFRDSYYLKARLLDVRTQDVINSSSEASSLASLEDILNVSSRLAERLCATVAPVEEEFSKIGFANKTNCDVITIDNTGANTIVTFKLYDSKGTIKWSMYAGTFIRDRATGNEYKLLSTNGIFTDHSEAYGVGIHEFSATFEKVPYSATNIDIIEPKGWEWTDIVLKNFGKTGLHQFRDESKEKFAHMMKERELMKRQEVEVGPIVNIVDTYRSYLVTITNENYGSAYIIQLEGKNIGTVEKRSTLTFRLAPEQYGQIKAIQRDGWLLSPTVHKFMVPPMKPNDRISFIIPRP